MFCVVVVVVVVAAAAAAAAAADVSMNLTTTFVPIHMFQQ